MDPLHRSNCGHRPLPGGARALAALPVLSALAALTAAVVACHKDPEVTERSVIAHAPAGCAAALDLDGQAYAVYQALGDFDAPLTVSGHPLGDVGLALSELNPATRALVLDATEAARGWIGVGAVAPTGDVDVLLLPSFTSCPLPMAVGARAGSVLAPIDGGRVLVVGGSGGSGGSGGNPGTDGGTDGGASSAPAPPVPSFVGRFDTGALEPVSPDLLTPRTRASATAFGTGALVAGGVDPRSSGSVLATAEVYSSDVGGFDQQHPILLSGPRADHGAAVLATGETVLVGGVTSATDPTSVLGSVEIVDPVTRTVRSENVASLAVPRRSPSVLRLASGEILVAGGFDGTGRPVPTLEWFAPDVSASSKRASALVAGAARAYAALPAGGALAVIAPPPDAGPDFQNTWVIAADGTLDPATPIAGSLTQPVLFGGAGGAPALWTGDRWLRWDPYGGAFVALGALDDAPAQVGDATTAPDPGLALWLDATSSTLTGLRFDARNDYSSLAGPLLVADTTDTAPDRLAAPGAIDFDPSIGVTLATGASVFVTDRTYADVQIDVDAPTGEPPEIVLRDGVEELEVGGVSCAGPLAVGGPATIHVTRSGAAVSWSVEPMAGADAGDDASSSSSWSGSAGTCAATLQASARVSVGLRGPESAARAVARNLGVDRIAP